MNRREILEIPEVRNLINLAYITGFSDGIESYAYMKRGDYFVGTGGQTLNEALSNIKKHTNFTQDLAAYMLEQARQAETWLENNRKTLERIDAKQAEI